MYIPEHYVETDTAVLHALMRSYPLGAWVSEANGELVANHIPFLVDSGRGEYGTLVGHVARANGIWASFSRTRMSVVVFQGPQTYITPSWYVTKDEDGKAVPTWNYAVVHAYGVPQVKQDKEWLLEHVSQLSETHESQRPIPWSVSDAPPEFIRSLLNGIVGIEIPISKIEGKWKTSQNRSTKDKVGVIAGLDQQKDSNSLEMSALVKRHIRAET